MTNQRGEEFLGDRLVWGGYAHGQLIATFTLRHSDEGWHLNLLAVRPDHGRKGYGNLALSEAEKRVLDLGATELLLDTAEQHPWLVDFYRSRGYVAYGLVQKPGNLAKDVLEIITVFSARLYGSRSRKNQKLLDGVKKAVEDVGRPLGSGGA